MNRMIKFRAWDKFEKKMLPVCRIEWENQAWASKPPTSDPSFSLVIAEGDDETIELDPDSVDLMQFTGFKDKNGKGIYEGDILEIIDWDESSTNVPKPTAWNKGDVDFRNGAFRIHAYVLAHVVRFVKIIGNIYENPELLNASPQA